MTKDMNRIKRSRPHDTSQELNSFSPDRIKEQRCPVDRLQTLHSNSYSTMDNSGRLLKLNPFLILDTDPSLDSLKFSSALPRTLRPIGNKMKNYTSKQHEVKQSNRSKKVFQYQNNSFDTYQKHNAFSPHGIKERRYPVDRLQTLRSNSHSSTDHTARRLLKLNPYPILDIDPSLDSLNFSSALTKSPRQIGNKIKDFTAQQYKLESSDRCNEVFQYNSRQWDENENNVEHEQFSNIDQCNYVAKIRQPTIHRQHKILPMVPPKHLNSTNSVSKTDGLPLITNSHLSNQNQIKKDLMDISKQKIIVNNVQIPSLMSVETNETFKTMKHFKDNFKTKEMTTKEFNDGKEVNINDQISLQTELIHNIKNDTSEKELEKSSDKMNKKIPLKIKRRVDTTNNTSVPSVNNSIIVNYSEGHSALRPSLFSNMPPYIRFSSHDIKGESFPLILQKLLKWKLSSITPIVVRRTIQNSGFKLVRSEHNLIDNVNDPSIITNQSDQNPISLQNTYGITPPIVDDFCGTDPLSNEFMMLPLSQSNDWVGTWGKHMKSLCFKTLREQQKLNHFPGTFQIGRKDRLWKNLHKLMLKYGKDQFGFIPTSYILPQEARALRQVWEKNDEDKWIVKPPASARGSGIRVISKWCQIPKRVPLVVQRYIDNPYLINDTKFDLRLYILITSINPLRLYLYDNGLVRFASVKYSSDMNTISDRYMHLTNYSINRLSSQYTQNEDADACQGHKWTLRSLWTYMEKERNIDVKKLWDSLADLVVKTVISGESPMNQMCQSNLSNRYNAYELFGIDVLFDEHLKPWILEVNISPSLHSSSPLDLAVKGPLVKDLMNMVGYHIPNKMNPSTHNTLLKMLGINSPLCYDKRLYTFNLSVKERKKQEYFTNLETREEYVNCILDELLPDDIRHLIAYEDELTQIGSFQKVFPTTSSHKYHQFFDGPRYYNMLLDAWECKYSDKREEGIAVLEKLCQLNVHLEVPDVDEEQSSKTHEVLQNTQMEVEKMLDKSGGDKINDNHQAVIS